MLKDYRFDNSLYQNKTICKLDQKDENEVKK